MRKTKQRDLILGIVSLNTFHMTAEEIYEECVKSLNQITYVIFIKSKAN